MGNSKVVLRRILSVAIVALFLYGCGDTINQINQPAITPLKIVSATYSFYSSSFPTTSGSTHSFMADIQYDGDVEGVNVFFETVLTGQEKGGISLLPSPLLTPGHHLNIYQNMYLENYNNYKFYFTLINTHGNESNRALGTLIP